MPTSRQLISRDEARAPFFVGIDLGVTSVVVTHDLHSALSIGNRIAMLSGGQIVELAEPQAFLSRVLRRKPVSDR